MSIRAAADLLRCSPRFVHELERGKPTARMDKVRQALSGLGLRLSVQAAATGQQEVQANSRASAQIEARAKQSLYEERLARAHDRIAARLALKELGTGEVSRARAQVRKWADQQICSRWYVTRWSRILEGSPREVAVKLLKLEPAQAKDLFQNTPFGFLVREHLHG